MPTSFKNYIYRLQHDLKLIAVEIERGDYDTAIQYCDEWLNGGALFQKPLSSVTYFQCAASLFYFRAQALLGKLNLMTVQSETKLESLLEDFKETVAKFNFYYGYSSWIYRKKMKSFRDMLIVEFCYVMSDEYTFNDWLEECLSIIEAQKKRHGKKNKLVYGELLIYVARGMFKKATDKNEIIGLMKELLQKAMDVYQKYDPQSPKVNEVNMLLEQIQATSSNVEVNIEQMNEILRAQAQHLNDDEVPVNDVSVDELIYLIEKARIEFSQNYLSAIQSLNNNSSEEMLIYAKRALDIGISYLSQLQTTYGFGEESIQLMVWLTNIYRILFNCEKDENYLLSAIDLWKEAASEIQSKSRKNRHEYFANMSEEELRANISMKDILSHFTDASNYCNYNEIEAMIVISAEINIGSCYLLMGDIQQGLNCKRKIEEILKFNDDIIDDEIAALTLYPMYVNLYQYYQQQQSEKAEQYYQLCSKIRKTMLNSEYSDQILFYDQLFKLDIE